MIKTELKICLLQASYGIGEQTYEVVYKSVLMDKITGRIVKVYPNGSLVFLLLSLLRMTGPIVEYGYGYDRLECMVLDIEAGRVSTQKFYMRQKSWEFRI